VARGDTFQEDGNTRQTKYRSSEAGAAKHTAGRQGKGNNKDCRQEKTCHAVQCQVLGRIWAEGLHLEVPTFSSERCHVMVPLLLLTKREVAIGPQSELTPSI
jgi:hypothetical protein